MRLTEPPKPIHLTWRDMVTTESVTVARHSGVTIVTDRFVLWDVDALRPVVPGSVPATACGHFTLAGDTFTPDPGGHCASAESLTGLFRDLTDQAESANVTAMLTEWSRPGVRVGVTTAGDRFGLDSDMADLIEDLGIWMRSTGDLSKPIGLFRPDGDQWRAAGLIQPLRWGDGDPIVDAIVTETLAEYRDDQHCTVDAR